MLHFWRSTGLVFRPELRPTGRYRLEKGPARLICDNLGLTRDATLDEYDRYMRSLQGMGSNAIRIFDRAGGTPVAAR